MALVAPDYSHWFVLEVELLSHSLEKHVVPQMRTIRYGAPQPDCISILSRELRIEQGQAANILKNIPRDVAVVANGTNDKWATALHAIQVQFLSVFSYRDEKGEDAFEVSGDLTAAVRNIGFGTFDATIGSIRFSKRVSLPKGLVQFEEPDGILSSWTVTSNEDFIWVTRQYGQSQMHNGAITQIVQKSDGRLVLRTP